LKRVAGLFACLTSALGAWSAHAEPDADARAVRELGALERESVNEALAGLGQTIEPAPGGKRIGRIHVVSQPVFSPRDGYFQWLNLLHRVTRPWSLQRELLLEPGQPWDEALVDESVRRIQSPAGYLIAGRQLFPPGLSSVVAIVPVRSTVPDRVDLLLVTRDLWSLRANTDFEFQRDTLTLFQTSLSENNLFGWQKFASFGFGFDQGAYSYGPTYVDPNIRGTRLRLWAAALLYSSRETGRHEGDDEMVSLQYPLYSLASRWGASLDVLHQSIVPRVFRGNDLRLVDLAATPDAESLPYVYRRRSLTIDANVARSFPGAVIQRVSGGFLLERRRSEVLSDFPGDGAAARLFLDQWAPIGEQRSEPYLRYEAFTPRYVALRDFGTFDLRETRQLGFVVRVRVSEGLPELGADFRALTVGATVGFAHSAAGSYVSLTAGASARLRHSDGQLLDQTGTVAAFAATPLIGGLIRIVATLEFDGKRADTSRTPFVVGGAAASRTYHSGEPSGACALRGYEIGEFIGNAAFAGHLELRTAARSLGSQRVGALAFYDVGHAARSFADLIPHNDVGVGLRWMIPQLNTSVVRIDWAVPLQDGVITRIGMPGRFSAGFQQAF
jgi:hypothetical protein